MGGRLKVRVGDPRIAIADVSRMIVIHRQALSSKTPGPLFLFSVEGIPEGNRRVPTARMVRHVAVRQKVERQAAVVPAALHIKYARAESSAFRYLGAGRDEALAFSATVLFMKKGDVRSVAFPIGSAVTGISCFGIVSDSPESPLIESVLMFTIIATRPRLICVSFFDAFVASENIDHARNLIPRCRFVEGQA
jgi:hypothetical protein